MTDRDIERLAALRKEAYAELQKAERELSEARKRVESAQERFLTVSQTSATNVRQSPGC